MLGNKGELIQEKKHCSCKQCGKKILDIIVAFRFKENNLASPNFHHRFDARR